jgi:hypothetical protein
LSEVNWSEIAENLISEIVIHGPQPNEDDDPIFGPVVFRYTRANALSDGVLIDVSKLAKEAGFKFPTAVTAGVWQKCIAIAESVKWNDETGRLWDVLNVLRYAIPKTGMTSRIDFKVSVQRSENHREDVPLYCLCHPGDDLEPVLTIMLFGED